jgi:hypothetical protein
VKTKLEPISLIWFGGLELPILVPVSENQTGTWYDLGTFITGINIYVFEEPDPELEWELRFLREKKEKRKRLEPGAKRQLILVPSGLELILISTTGSTTGTGITTKTRIVIF